jgi:hypothetical protein
MPARLRRQALTVAQFDVPAASNADCALTQSPASSQFTIISGMAETDATGDNNANLKAAVAAACRVCDVNLDGKADTTDLRMVRSAFGKAAQAGDLRDAKRDGRINVEDLRIGSWLCTNQNCNLIGGEA